ncbi:MULTISPECIES: hypothetical protein [Paenibacillus]|uniref:DUF4085 family protein n=1 Tax=Paenibacillus campinasensis TaxID=66347 RepID=A0A268ETB4_9BACL|nr:MULTISPECIES: hypothetical protein [Paenibacillus]PAD76350.1 hypothetical protein CHH67_12020 [Paenibacillus campinasensis]PAK55069.1 hypothetical protein CHH75_04710 [Paenibacillus sp. 7541]
MKYFRYDLFIAQNTDNVPEEERQEVDRQWQHNREAYSAILKTLSSRLPVDVYAHFNSWGFHDYRLTKMDIEHRSLHDMSVHFTLSSDIDNEENEELWCLCFDKVSYIQYQHLNYDNDQCVMHPEIDDWLYEEIMPVNESMLSFEVLFSSGGNVVLHFPDQSVSIKRVK